MVLHRGVRSLAEKSAKFSGVRDLDSGLSLTPAQACGGHAAVFETPPSQREVDVIFKSSICSIWKGTDLFGCVLRARHKRATTLCAGPSGTCTKASKIGDVSPFDATNWFGQPRYFVMN
jgi:hypothetical protein